MLVLEGWIMTISEKLTLQSLCCLSQDTPYPVEAVVLVGGYVVHQVTAADSLKTGDQVELRLDQVNTRNRYEMFSS